MTNKSLTMALIAVAIIAIAGVFTPLKTTVQNAFGGVTNYDEVDATAIKIGGSSGSRLGPIIAGTCSLIAGSFSVAASTTVSMDCAVTGVVTGDTVFADFATSTVTGNGWAIDGSSASTTSGFLTLRVTNWTGTSNIIPASVASSTDYLVLHAVSTVPGL